MPPEVWLEAPVRPGGMMDRMRIRQTVWRLAEGGYAVRFEMPALGGGKIRADFRAPGDCIPPAVERQICFDLFSRAVGRNE